MDPWLTGVKAILILVASFGIWLGAFSLFAPARSIQLYQWIMRRFNWNVQPIDRNREIRNTQALGALTILLSASIVSVLLRTTW